MPPPTKLIRSGAFRVFLRDEVGDEGLIEALLPDPERLLAQGEELVTAWLAGNTKKGRLTCQGRRYFYKQYLPKGWFYGIKNFFRKSKALRAWHFDEVFTQYSIPTIPPVLCVERRCCGLLGPAYLFFPLMEGWDNLLNLWEALSDRQKRESMTVLGDMIGRMHRHGLLHGDLNWRNLLFSVEDGHLRAAIIDLDGCKLIKKPDISQMKGDLDHFIRDVERSGAEPWVWETFESHWRSAVQQES